jgi:hypothetical protein
MKIPQGRPMETRRPGSEDEAVLEEHIAEIFRGAPMLAGFAVREDFEFDDVSVYGTYAPSDELREALVEALAALAEEHPGAAMLLRGRTFARSIH